MSKSSKNTGKNPPRKQWRTRWVDHARHLLAPALCRSSQAVCSLLPRQIRQLPHIWNGTQLRESKKVPITKSAFGIKLFNTIHLVALLGTVIIIALNIKGMWVGKELTGPRDQDGLKLLALQITSKLLDQLVLTSLGLMILSYVYGLLTTGNELPFGVLSSGQNFKDISYLWSEEMFALYASRYSFKHRILILLFISTILGSTVGPAAATAMAPKLNNWLIGEVNFRLNTTSQQLWPSTLTLSSGAPNACTSSPGQCGGPNTWSTVAENLFSYWSIDSIGGVQAVPEKVNIAGRASVRTLNVRFRGPFTLYQPDVTVATTQPVAIAEAVNALRLAWFRANGILCRTGKGYCSYRDIQWSVQVPQPNVFAVCRGAPAAPQMLFPTFSRNENQPTAFEQSVDIRPANASAQSFLQWTALTDPAFGDTSVGVLVQPRLANSQDSGLLYACTIKAQWADSVVQGSFIDTPFSINGAPPDWFEPQALGSPYHGQTVKISPDWASLANPEVNHNGLNASVFDTLFAAGSLRSAADIQAKIECVLTVMLAERMAQISAEAGLLGTLDNLESIVKSKGDALNVTTGAMNSSEFLFRTIATGYAYGLYTASGLSTSNLLSLVILMIYAAMVTLHLLATSIRRQPLVKAWRNVVELLTLALHSPWSDDLQNTSAGIDSLSTLQLPLSIAMEDNHAALIIGWKQKPGITRRKLEPGVSYD